MKLQTLKIIVFFSVIVVFAIIILLIFTLYRPYLFLGENGTPNQFTPLLINVIGVFSVHLGVIIASYFSSYYISSNKKANERHYIAFSVIILWLIGILFFIVYSGIEISSHEGMTIEIFNEDFGKINTAANFLIAGALIFLFVNHKSTESKTNNN